MPLHRLPYDPILDEDPSISTMERLRLKLIKYENREGATFVDALMSQPSLPSTRTVYDRLLDEEDLL